MVRRWLAVLGVLGACGDDAPRPPLIDAPPIADMAPVRDMRMSGECVLTSSDAGFELPVGVVVGAVTFAGQPPPVVPSGAPGPFLAAVAGDDITFLSIFEGQLAGILLPGTYDLYYFGNVQQASDARGQPANTGALVKSGVVINGGGIGNATNVDVDVSVATVQGALTIDGVPAPSARLDFRSTAGSATPSFAPAFVTNGSYETKLVPGTYDVYYTSRGAPGTPANTSALVRSGVTLTGTMQVDLDLSPELVTGSIVVDGAAPPVGASVRVGGFVSTLSGDRTTYSILLLPGTYRVVYSEPELTAGAGLVTVAAAPATRDVALTTFTVTGAAEFGGVPLASNTELSFGDAATGSSSSSVVKSGNYSVRLAGGTYAITYRRAGGDATAPANRSAVVETGVVLAAATTHAVHIPRVTISGNTTFAQREDQSVMRFIAADGAVADADIEARLYAAAIVPGTYDVEFARDGAEGHAFRIGSMLPATTDMRIDAMILSSRIRTTITIEGMPVPGVRLALRNATGEVRAITASDGSTAFDLPLGSWDVFTTASTGAGVPSNSNGKIGCVVVEQ